MDFSLEKTLLKPIAALAIILIVVWFITVILEWIERKTSKSSFFPYSKKLNFLALLKETFMMR
ncbi:MAG TPA: hypothetical protein EYQ03_06905 [Nitrospinaceae bacterium]|jgi:hypothetical protein|nr:hypothetical protein [Nitrospina sp.]HIE80354.1 hypothetical protein [Nitrospinaceae bacterium]|tara:strand:+ start:4617 stop:4805 length:189 start_codon:yes stop_codon:yes gene_type:complete